jgi:3-deoxy-7-phosphoheptulonate synthase
MTRHLNEQRRISGLDPLLSPQTLAYYLPGTDQASALVAATRSQAEAIVSGSNDRLLVVVGPCTIHDPDAALEYAIQLKALANRLQDDILVIMRVYFEKSRTIVPWRGLINDPHLDDSFDINHGLRVARKLLLDLSSMGIPAGTEFLDTVLPRYIEDLVAWAEIGTRNTEAEIYREMSSGLPMPVGLKNSTGGSIQSALDAIQSASQSHHYLSVTMQGVSAIVATAGNDTCHLILCGGKSGPNYDKASIRTAETMLRNQNLPPFLMVDCSHENSSNDFNNSPRVARDLCQQIAAGSLAITAVMIESNLVEGNQQPCPDLSRLVRGQSVTDACINWDTTVKVLEALAQAVRQRRTR